MTISALLEKEFSLQTWQVENILQLIDAGNTIPFIARYRKEATGNLDDQVLRELADRLQILRNLEDRKSEVRRLIDEQNQLTAELDRQISQATTLTELDDLYRPYRPKRRTRALIARESGLQPLADLLLSQPGDEASLHRLAGQLVRPDQGIPDAESAFAGAMDILAEQVADEAWVRRSLRRLLQRDGTIESKCKTAETTVYEAYYQYAEPVARIAGHRVLALNRGEREKILSVKITLPPEQPLAVIRSWLIRRDSAASPWLLQVSEDAWKRLLAPSLETEIRGELTEQAEAQAIRVFAANLRSLLLQPPIRGRRVLGLDPGFRTGCKLAVVDATGRVLDTGVIYPNPPHSQVQEAAAVVSGLVLRHRVDLVAIGNGTASRESEAFISGLIREKGLPLRYLMVSEAGASVYSASRLAADEFPEYDVSLRSAVSIARRLQDPLAELVKIEPRSIGVGQYQHDLNNKRLDESLQGVVESCVNEVGVDLNTASPSLLSYVAGLNASVARNIVAWREKNGPFLSRQTLLQVPHLGPKAFEQSAGFLRIPGAREPLDNTSVHPESYERVHALSQMLKTPPSPELAEQARRQSAKELAARLGVGELTFLDILDALARPGRDPRDDLPQPTMRSDVLDLKDLRPDMVLQGIVRNVADFGAFVDIGVHQDGLVHVSELADRFVRSPMEVVSTGQAVTVRILQVDPVRKRIALTMKGLTQPAKGGH
ncbi:MAG TPA: RNA-binding transcriptional accessory protein [Clostridiales bacterium]|nr:RNA-binding transcriptional accessory protein [Clostridiales bacterium]